MASIEVIVLDSDVEDENSEVPPDSKPNEQEHKGVSYNLLKEDLETLEGLSWVNDAVVNSYLDLIVERSKKDGYVSAYAFNTFFYNAYRYKGYQNVKRWTRKVDIFSYDINFVPLNMYVHWGLAVIDHRAKKVCYYDSMGFDVDRCLDLICDYLCEEYADKKGKVLDPNTYTKKQMEDIPLQMNGSDSGVFILNYAEYISRGAKLTFAQNHSTYFRKKMVRELIDKQLMSRSALREVFRQ